MARPLRLEFPGALWHVTSRGNEKQPIVRDDSDRRSLRSLLGAVVKRFGWRLHAYVLMTNHYHLVVETPEPTLSRGMGQLNGRYAQRFNRRHSRVGHLFQGRFGGRLVQKDKHLLAVVRYVVLNPVRARLVGLPEEYPWSNYLATAGYQTAPEWLDIGWTLAQFDEQSRRGGILAYRQFVSAELAEDVRARVRFATGDSEFRRDVQGRIDGQLRSVEHLRREVRVHRVRIEAVVSAAADVFKVARDRVTSRGRHKARSAVALLAREDPLMSLSEIGRHLNVRETAVCYLLKRAREQLIADPDFACRVEEMRRALAQNCRL